MGRKGPNAISGGCRLSWCAVGVLFLLAVQGVHSEHEPTESECRPYIVKALKEHHVDDEVVSNSVENEVSIEQEENSPTDEITESGEEKSGENKTGEEGDDTAEIDSTENKVETGESQGGDQNKTDEENDAESSGDNISGEQESQENSDTANDNATKEDDDDQEGSGAETNESQSNEDSNNNKETDSDNVSQKLPDLDDSQQEDSAEGTEESKDVETKEEQVDTAETNTAEETDGSQEGDATEETTENQEGDVAEENAGSHEGETEETESQEKEEGETAEGTTESQEGDEGETAEGTTESQEDNVADGSSQDTAEVMEGSQEQTEETDSSTETAEKAANSKDEDSVETDASKEEASVEASETDSVQDVDGRSQEGNTGEVDTEEDAKGSVEETEQADAPDEAESSVEGTQSLTEKADADASQETVETATSQDAIEEVVDQSKESEGTPSSATEETESKETVESSAEGDAQDTKEESSEDSKQESEPVEELTREAIIPANLRPRDHITQILKLDEDSVEKESALAKTIDGTLNTLKKLYDSAIKPLEILYKYRDLSNRHFGDPEIFSKPLILLMGPWSGGKSSTINYLLDLEFTELALRTGAEPSPAYFNILTHGEETEILDGTQLAADWTFSGLQKFGQGLLDRLRGVKLKNRLLEKVNIVEIPGILEIRKQVQRLFPFNDACQWFIDRADIIFLVYDPAKLDVGPETEAILDQLKGREYQTRIILNKADQVKPEELMRVQGTLIWNISPLMSSQEPPVMYTTSLWSLPYETHAPTRLLHAQERAFLRDLRDAIDKRVENKIASARRFAVRVRNHAKMVDCYLTTYYNHKSFFGNKKKISDDIIENPQKYHIYEGLSTLTNISRYDLPDPEMYRDFFRINPLYDFTKLSETCTYFRGCPINKLDIAIAYDLPDLVGKYKKAVEQAKTKS